MKLILAVGVSNSGKTTWSIDYCKHNHICRISTDELRAIIGKDESDQTVSHLVFRTAETMTEYFFQQGLSVLIDATNYSVKNRKNFIKLARKYNAVICAYVFNKCSLDELKARNQARARQVPDDVIERQFNNLVIPTKEEVNFICLETDQEFKWYRPHE